MEKPTSKLNFAIIEFAFEDSEVNNLLTARDKHPETFGIRISCEFLGRNPKNLARSAYDVRFIYDVQIPSRQNHDDVSVIIEVEEGLIPRFQILHISTF